jgi:hypothetical protein
MSTTKIVVIAFLTLFLGVGAALFIANIQIGNTEISLRKGTTAQEERCKAYFDKMWKIVNQKAQVADRYKDAFKEIYVPLIEGRYSQGDGSLMKWITEHNPQFDPSLYKDVMQSIEIERTGYFNEQSILIDKQREHEVYITQAPARWFLPSTIEPVKITIVTSSATKDTYKTGEENDVELFSNKKSG